MKFLKQLKARRKALKLTQQDIADLLHICREQYNRLENGKSNITLDQYETAMTYLTITEYIREIDKNEQ